MTTEVMNALATGLTEIMTEAVKERVELVADEWPWSKTIEAAIEAHNFGEVIDTVLKEVDWKEEVRDAIQDAIREIDLTSIVGEAIELKIDEILAKQSPWTKVKLWFHKWIFGTS